MNSDASVEDKRQFLADFRLPFKIDPYVVEERVEKVWGETAVFGGLVRPAGPRTAAINSECYAWHMCGPIATDDGRSRTRK